MKPLLLLLLVPLRLFGAEAKPPIYVPLDAHAFNGRWYKVYLDPVTWTRAKEKCESRRGQLAVVPDEKTWKFLKNLTEATVWLGATDEKHEGVWKWIDGTPWTYSAWLPDHPNNVGGVEHYLEIYKKRFE